MISPCVSEKCLMYPICINKIKINCDKLLEYFHIIDDKYMHHDRVWERLNTDLPKLCQVRGDDGKYK